MSAIQIPKTYRSGFEKFLHLEKKQVDELLAAIGTTKPTAPSAGFVSEVGRKIRTVEPADSEEIISALIGLHSGRAYNEMSVGEFAKALSESEDAQSIKKEDPDLEATFVRVLTDEALALAAKANDVRSDHEHSLCEARILTDMRPIFKQTPTDIVEGKPSAALIIHTLKIRYHERDILKEFFVAMDASDLVDLKLLISRAEAKEQGIRAALTEAKILCLDT